ncbi:MAG: FtsX-like permease family protein [Ruminococcus sp.]|nr:FtsX-like permease family protein [Ruminococcus sp.]
MSNLSFFPKLAIQNIKKNGKFYFPYILTCIGTIAGFYIMLSISGNEGVTVMKKDSLNAVLAMGSDLVGIFSVLFLFYTNSFLMKRRTKEIGLYNILGMEKRHIGKILFFETLFIGILSLIIGLLAGIIFDKLVLLILTNIINFESGFEFYISINGIICTVFLFGVIFLAQLIYNLFKIHLSKPIELLNGSKKGEKEPKTKWIMTILGILSLGIGYYIAVTTQSPILALSNFFFAVILVVIGTYFLFVAITISVLKLLKKNKKFYYKSNHFISVSGMIYRMKQNAVGLANICILSTMVLVMVSSTVCLYAGINDTLTNRFPGDIDLEYAYDDEITISAEEIYDNVMTYSEEMDTTVSDYRKYEYLSFSAKQEGPGFSLNIQDSDTYSIEEIATLFCMTSDEYNTATNSNVNLKENEIAVYSNKNKLPGKVNIGNMSFKNTADLDKDIKEITGSFTAIPNYHIIVVKNRNTLNDLYKLQSDYYEDDQSYIITRVCYNISGSNEEKIAYGNGIWDSPINGISLFNADSKAASEQDLYDLYGGFLFLGVFLGLLFIMAAILIIYYKQISEGYEDKERYNIMQKVGLSKREIKSSINSQVLMVFFLPILVAVMHVGFCFPLITKLLLAFGITNNVLLLIVTLITIAVFILIYSIVYTLTSKIYYNIVKN